MNASDAGQAANVPGGTELPGASDGPVEQPPVGGDGTPTHFVGAPVPATDAGQVENLLRETPPPRAERVDPVERIRSHPELTLAMRQRLAELVQRQPPGEGPPQIALDDVLAILAETIPSQLRLEAGELPTALHPEGESFFTGDPASDADKHAAAVASEQLALSGLLRR